MRPASTWIASLAFAAAGAALPTSAGAITLFSEDFDGYTVFSGSDPSNAGIPQISEGADETWYGIRFQTPDSACSPSSSLDCDIAVQKIGSSTAPVNNTPVGRFEDEAGLVFHVSTTGLTAVTLDFDWRLFSASGADNMKVGYFTGPITPYDTSSSLIATSSSSPYKWANWTALTPAAGLSSNSFQHQTYSLPSNTADVWVVFWLDNGEGDYGKIDNVIVTAVPEPGTLLLLGLGIAALGAPRRKA